MTQNNPLCSICTKTASKYKCPNCEIRYCSVVCFKVHKETPCIKPVVKPEEEKKPTQTNQERAEQQTEDENRYIVTSEDYECLRASSEVCGALKDSRLQAIIKEVDSCQNDAQKQQMIQKLRESNPEFGDFVNLILKTIGAVDRDGLFVL
eukprot:TRINITY_DN4375_c0_g1_i2.p1 TRINITY_DN4375_c0_g1~~TRINITY_DN4375_c0_g1_i2.p1  ORF type:complete len:150 (-),score=34.18 TRINITY_DN4375_c0_g1_i2:144-593(-)